MQGSSVQHCLPLSQKFRAPSLAFPPPRPKAFPPAFSPSFPATVLFHCKLFSSVSSFHLTTIPCSLSIPTKLYVMNAKACTVVELYGTLDPVTRDWTDGLLSCIFREINKPTDKNERKYIVFDSDVDALWVENMNSVMDDNRLLTLANGERIRLQKHCALLFEVILSESLSVSYCIRV